MSTPDGITTTSLLGTGAQGTVRLGIIEKNATGDTASWSAGPVAVKTWENKDDGAAVAAMSVGAIFALPGDALAALVADNIVMPLSVYTGVPAAIVMPVGVALSNRDWRHVIAVTDRLLQSGTNIVHMDVKAPNLMWHRGAVKFIDHEALCVAGVDVAGMPSYAPWDWRRWAAQTTPPPPQRRSDDPAAYDDAYFTAYDKIEALLRRDSDGAAATMMWGALCTAVTMTTGHGNPALTREMVETLQCPAATRMYDAMVNRFGASAIGAAATELGAWRTPPIT